MVEVKRTGPSEATRPPSPMCRRFFCCSVCKISFRLSSVTGGGLRVAPDSPAGLLIHGQQGTREAAALAHGAAERIADRVLVDTGFVNQGESRALGELYGITT
jgi:hypothetical protein